MKRYKRIQLQNISEEGASANVFVEASKVGKVGVVGFAYHSKKENRKRHKKDNEYKTTMMGKQVHTTEKVEDGDICASCGMTNETHKMVYGCRLHRHHDLYDENNPLKYTRLLCARCHQHHHHMEKGGR